MVQESNIFQGSRAPAGPIPGGGISRDPSSPALTTGSGDSGFGQIAPTARTMPYPPACLPPIRTSEATGEGRDAEDSTIRNNHGTGIITASGQY